MAKGSDSKFMSFVHVVGMLILLLGVYVAGRTAINIVAFDKYPPAGVLTFNFSGSTPYPSREQDCTSPQLYYEPDGKTTRPATPEEKANESINQKNCLDDLTEARKTAKVNDISQAFVLLLIGTATVSLRKFFFR